MVFYVVLAVVVAIMLPVCMQIDNWQRDWTTNHAELEEDAADADLRPLKLASAPEVVERQIAEWVQSQPKWSQGLSSTSEGVTTIHLTRTTGLMRYTDDITVTLVPDGDQTRVEAESQSRVGKGDLGQNPRNLKELVRGLRG